MGSELADNLATPLLPEAITVCCLQWDIRRDNVAANLECCDAMLAEAALQKPHIVILPEMWSRSFCGDNLASEAGFLDERKAFCSAKARENRIWLAAGTLPEPATSGKVFNTMFIFDPTGKERLAYRKIHLFPNTNEPKYFEAGNELPLPVAAGPWNIGVGICFDLRFPELFRRQMLAGANLFLVPAQFPDPREDHFTLLARARALENQAALVAVNRCGSEATLTFFGGSLAAGPFGEITASSGRKPGILTARFRFAELQKLRRDYPFIERTPLL
ncbi:MAG: carbon-nitrogen family hydrolase [Candidatus Riflebacteria bacterium]|nr:carbon-nitrogen family hydrolase [Candidatus Riflebacteria bacterium]